MPAYCTSQIEKGKLNFNTVVQKYPTYKLEIEVILTNDGYVINEDGTVSK